jgi:fumarate reductase subunit D
VTIAKKAFVWGLFAAGGTVAAIIFPVLIVLFLLLSLGNVPEGLQFGSIHAFAQSWVGKSGLFLGISLSLWHSAHRLRTVFHDFGARSDGVVAKVVYLTAITGTLITAFFLLKM